MSVVNDHECCDALVCCVGGCVGHHYQDIEAFGLTPRTSREGLTQAQLTDLTHPCKFLDVCGKHAEGATLIGRCE